MYLFCRLLAGRGLMDEHQDPLHFAHNAATLGGSSGSPVLNGHYKVVGIHTMGATMVENGALYAGFIALARRQAEM